MRQLQSTDKTGRSPNERFCKSGAVTPQKVLCEFESLYPAGTFVEAPPSQSRRNENWSDFTGIIKTN